MRKILIVSCFVILGLAFSAVAQEEKKDMTKEEKAKVYTVKSSDVSTIDGIMKATYDSISGAKDEKRNWDRFRSLFHPDARLIPSGTNPNTGITGAKAYTPDEYIKLSEPILMGNGFYEKEIARRTENFGNIAHVFSTYEARNKLSEEKPFLRGINSFQLLNDGKRWWVLTIYWQAESPKNPIPGKYLKTVK